jgi:uncharacterized protein
MFAHPSGTWPFWIGGIAIGLFVVLFAWTTGKALGVSTGYGSLCGRLSAIPEFKKKPYADPWRLWFILGIPLGGLVSALLAGNTDLKPAIPVFEAPGGPGPLVKVGVFVTGGFLVGYGARWAGG